MRIIISKIRRGELGGVQFSDDFLINQTSEIIRKKLYDYGILAEIKIEDEDGKEVFY